MAINILYFSTVDHDWNGHPSVLLNHKNFKQAILSAEQKNYHTSTSDIKTENLYHVCQHAKELVMVGIDLDYVAHVIDADEMYNLGRLYYEFYRNQSKVADGKLFDQLSFELFDNLTATRPCSSSVLWTVGCSYTFGDGVLPHQRWGQILSEKINLQEISLSKSGASIHWAADQIMRSDLRKGDVLVWGLTTIPRIEFADGWYLNTGTLFNAVNSKTNRDLYKDFNYYTSRTHVLQCIHDILAVINFCRIANVELYVINLIETSWLPMVFAKYENFLDLTVKSSIASTHIPIPKDIGLDDLHPGPTQHEEYAELIFNFIQERRKYRGQTI